jgi:hypothetical protein
MICGLLIFQTPVLDRPLASISPWLDMLTRTRASVVADLEAQSHRRFIKTHTPLDGLPWDDRVTYICIGRDPRDVALSWDHHTTNENKAALLAARRDAVGLDDIKEVLARPTPPFKGSLLERFWAWVDDAAPPAVEGVSLRRTLYHLSSFWAVKDRPNVVLVRYEDLETDLEGQMRSLADRLGIPVPTGRWPDLVKAATFECMRERADQLVPLSTHGLWKSNRQFFHRGTSGQWRQLLDSEGLKRYQSRVAELADPSLAKSVHSE